MKKKKSTKITPEKELREYILDKDFKIVIETVCTLFASTLGGKPAISYSTVFVFFMSLLSNRCRAANLCDYPDRQDYHYRG